MAVATLNRDELQYEIEKAVNGLGDWEKVVKLSSDVLSQTPKDLVVAGYWAVGLLHTNKQDGLINGSQTYLNLIEKNWDDLQPAKTRARGRSRAVSWWIEKTAGFLKSEGNSLTPEQAGKLSARLKMVNEFLDQNLEDCPSFRPIIDGLTAPVISEIEPEVEFKSAESAPKEIATVIDAEKALESLSEQARQVGAHLLGQDATNPLVYRLNRFALWMNLDECPPATKERTLLPAPDQNLLKRLADLRKGNDAEALLQFAEEQIFQHIFWLDLNRVSFEALSALGEKFAKAAESLSRETAAFVQRLGGIENLTFADGQPLADAETRRWLKKIKGGQAASNAADTELKEIKQRLKNFADALADITNSKK